MSHADGPPACITQSHTCKRWHCTPHCSPSTHLVQQSLVSPEEVTKEEMSASELAKRDYHQPTTPHHHVRSEADMPHNDKIAQQQ